MPRGKNYSPKPQNGDFAGNLDIDPRCTVDSKNDIINNYKLLTHQSVEGQFQTIPLKKPNLLKKRQIKNRKGISVST